MAQSAVESPAQSVRIPVARDTWISSVDRERSGSNGGSARMKLKSYQEMSLVDIDAAELKGRVIEKATLFLRTAPGATLQRITVSTCSAEWFEGSGTNYASEVGVSTFQHRRHPDIDWSYPGSDFCSVVLGQGNSRWRSADASPADKDGWQHVPVDPAVVAHRIAELSHGFLIFDDTGSEWKRDGETFTAFPFPNRYIFSREQSAKHAAYFELLLGTEDRLAPQAPTYLQCSASELPEGQAWISWLTPKDQGPAGTLGFNVKVNNQTIPRYLIPRAGKPGQRVHMHLRDVALRGTTRAAVSIAAVDAAGNIGPALDGNVELSGHISRNLLKSTSLALATSSTEASSTKVKLGEANVAIIDELDKVHPITGEMLPKQSAGYLSSNHMWNADKRVITLCGARKECVAFQVLLSAPVRDVVATVTLEGDASKAIVRLGTYSYVATDRGPLPDPIIPLTQSLSIPTPTENIDGQKYGSIHVEIEIPEGSAAGIVGGLLQLKSADAQCDIPIELQVWDFALPDRLTYLPEMNCYGLPANELDYYRLAHQHRTVLNRLPYSHRGTVDDGCAPRWNGQQYDWEAWDKRFGPLFDGSAFHGLPRSGTPIECFYLPLFENWPIPIGPHYNDGYWADQALSGEYREQFMLASQRIAEHLRDRGWDSTLFHFYLNGKNDFKKEGWSRSTSPWLLDEPAHFQDFWALRWFGDAFHEGINRVDGPKPLVFRADISRPEWQRDTLDGVIDYNVVGSAFRRYRRPVIDRRTRFGEIVVEYGTTNRPDQANLQPVAWCIDTWSLGIDGVLPWQTIGRDQSWKKGDELSLFYPQRTGDSGPVPSIRLKAYRRGQQDVEYLALAAQSLGMPRWEMGQMVRSALAFDKAPSRGARENTNNAANEDAGRMGYGGLLPQEFDSLRKQVAAWIPVALPQPVIGISQRAIPRREPATVSAVVDEKRQDTTSRYEPPKSEGSPSGAKGKSDQPALRHIKLQGTEVVEDCILSLDEPEKNFGGEPRSNAIRRAETCAPLLIRFELSRAAVKSSAVMRARLVFYVWDPSGQGRTQVAIGQLRAPWKETEAAWKRPRVGSTWNNGKEFAFESDCTQPVARLIVEPDEPSIDVIDPPREISIDITSSVKQWLDSPERNFGLAICPIVDRSVDEGHHTRFQVFASEHRVAQWTPRLEIESTSSN